MNFYEKIVTAAFEKAKESVTKDNKNAKSVHISKEIDTFIIGDLITKDTLTKYYDKYVLKQKSNFNEPSLRVMNSLAKYLGFKNFIDFKKNFQKKLIEEETLISSPKNEKPPFKPLIIVGIIVLTLISVWIVKDLFKTDKKLIPQKIEITNHNYHGDLNYYYNVDDKGIIELYDKKGIVSGKPLTPVTKEIMFTYFEQNNNKDIRKWRKEIVDADEELQRNDISDKNKLEIEIKEIEPIKKKAIKNTEVEIINNGIVDVIVSTAFKQKYTNTKEKYTCNGTVEYTYKENSISSKLIVCNAILIYTVVSNNTGEEIDSGMIKSVGTDTSETGAKQNAISRIIIK